MLCSTNDFNVRSTWQHLGFNFTTEEEMEHKWDIPHSDLVYLQNTVQMYKDLPGGDVRRWKPVLIKHGQFKARTYARIGEGRPPMAVLLPPSKRQARGGGGSGAAMRFTPSISEISFGDRPTTSRCALGSLWTKGYGDILMSLASSLSLSCGHASPLSVPHIEGVCQR